MQIYLHLLARVMDGVSHHLLMTTHINELKIASWQVRSLMWVLILIN